MTSYHQRSMSSTTTVVSGDFLTGQGGNNRFGGTVYKSGDRNGYTTSMKVLRRVGWGLSGQGYNKPILSVAKDSNPSY